MYRLPRRDVPEKALEAHSHGQRLLYRREHVHHVNDRGDSYRVKGLPELFTNAAGDFTVLSRDMYLGCTAFPRNASSIRCTSTACSASWHTRPVPRRSS